MIGIMVVCGSGRWEECAKLEGRILSVLMLSPLKINSFSNLLAASYDVNIEKIKEK